MKRIVQEALERKVVWPWPKIGEEGSEAMLKILKQQGYKEWKNPKEKKDEKWRLDMPLDFITGNGKLKYFLNAPCQIVYPNVVIGMG